MNPVPRQVVESVHIGKREPDENMDINSVEITEERNELVKADGLIKLIIKINPGQPKEHTKNKVI